MARDVRHATSGRSNPSMVPASVWRVMRASFKARRRLLFVTHVNSTSTRLRGRDNATSQTQSNGFAMTLHLRLTRCVPRESSKSEGVPRTWLSSRKRCFRPQTRGWIWGAFPSSAWPSTRGPARNSGGWRQTCPSATSTAASSADYATSSPRAAALAPSVKTGSAGRRGSTCSRLQARSARTRRGTPSFRAARSRPAGRSCLQPTSRRSSRQEPTKAAATPRASGRNWL
mmetsp:Transcript_62877/g.148003  ORF Transcript_62877/g.148003 Transcript_62877/m.148003 type:complete len:229 (-) Transcript_62877:1494-2180(-)